MALCEQPLGYLAAVLIAKVAQSQGQKPKPVKLYALSQRNANVLAKWQWLKHKYPWGECQWQDVVMKYN